MPLTDPTYVLDRPDLSQSVSIATPAKQHRALLASLDHAFPGVRLVTQRGRAFLGSGPAANLDGPSYLGAHQVIGPDGAVVSTNHSEWLKAEFERDGGRAAVTRSRLAAGGYHLARTEISSLYFTRDRGGADQADAVQIEVELQRVVCHSTLFDKDDAYYRAPSDLRDLIWASERGRLPDAQRRELVPFHYVLRSIIDLRAFVDVAQQLELVRRVRVRALRWNVTENYGRPDATTTVQTQDELHPGWDLEPVRERRWFDDWAASSAGLDGARAVDHWAFDCSDYVDPEGTRHVSFVPLWADRPRLAEINARKCSDYGLMDRVERIDEKLGVPFGWFFYMLHGNRIKAEAGERLLEAAEQGRIVLPEHDYRILKRWKAHFYGF